MDGLELKAGATPTWEHFNDLGRAIERTARLPSFLVMRTVRPWGTHDSYIGVSGAGSSPIFQPIVTVLPSGNAEVRWNGPTAMIGGVVPTLNGLSIFKPDPATNLLPALTVKPSDFNQVTGECGIYFAVTATALMAFSPSVVTPVAKATLPPVTVNTGYKLALFLRLRNGVLTYDEDNDRELFCAQGFLAVNTLQSGKFESIFWATF